MRAGKRLFEIRTNDPLVRIEACDLHVPRQHTVAGLRADGGGLQNFKLARILLIGEILQPRQTHFDKVEAQFANQPGIFGLGADAQTNHRFPLLKETGRAA